MEEQKGINPKDLSIWLKSIQRLQLIGRLFFDREVPFTLKLLPVFGVLYLIFPFDISPDLVPGLGQLDDLGVLLLTGKLFVDFSPKHIVEQHRLSILKRFGVLEQDDDGIVIVPDDVK